MDGQQEEGNRIQEPAEIEYVLSDSGDFEKAVVLVVKLIKKSKNLVTESGQAEFA